ncbi:MAG: hypothetical protein BMS9Abin01_2866 [Gammaproteobacteria bacterium]|nr:MAG: hypothetical protein BMS9Abin01_2866 [Gammaproteobacteria bacterium]
MKDRLLTIAGGLVAFALVVILLVPVERDDSGQISRPLSTDRGRAGLQGLKRWIEQGGVATDVLRRRYTALASRFELSLQGNLLIVSLPQRTPSRRAERQALRTWLAQGNSALVLVAAGNVPRWTMGSDGSSTGDFLGSFGFELAMQRDNEEEKAANGDGQVEESFRPPRANLEAWQAGEPVALLPRFRHPLTRDVATVSARSLRALERGWNLTGTTRGRVVLPLLAEADNGAAFWEARVGAGRMWVSRYSDLFANAGLGEADNARFMANLLASALGRNGRVIFDDMHQGATDLYDAKAFFSDPRFVNTMIFMAAFWLLYLGGRSRRLAPAREAVSRYYAADLARAMAGFFVRRLSAVTVARQLFAFFFNDIRSRYGLPTNGQPVWSMLSGMSRVSTDDINGLRAHYERAAAGRKLNLSALARLMQRTRESLL